MIDRKVLNLKEDMKLKSIKYLDTHTHQGPSFIALLKLGDKPRDSDAKGTGLDLEMGTIHIRLPG